MAGLDSRATDNVSDKTVDNAPTPGPQAEVNSTPPVEQQQRIGAMIDSRDNPEAQNALVSTDGRDAKVTTPDGTVLPGQKTETKVSTESKTEEKFLGYKSVESTLGNDQAVTAKSTVDSMTTTKVETSAAAGKPATPSSDAVVGAAAGLNDKPGQHADGQMSEAETKALMDKANSGDEASIKKATELGLLADKKKEGAEAKDKDSDGSKDSEKDAAEEAAKAAQKKLSERLDSDDPSKSVEEANKSLERAKDNPTKAVLDAMSANPHEAQETPEDKRRKVART